MQCLFIVLFLKSKPSNTLQNVGGWGLELEWGKVGLCMFIKDLW